MVIGDAGCGKTTLAEEIRTRLTCKSAIATWTNQGETLGKLCEDLGIALQTDKVTTSGKVTGKRNKSNNELKAELKDFVKTNKTVLFADNAHDYGKAMLTILQQLMDLGAVLVLLSVSSSKKGLWLKCAEIILETPSEAQIREIISKYAVARGIRLSPPDINNLQRYAGGNPMLAIAAVQDESLALRDETQSKAVYVDIAPFVNCFLMSLGVLRFYGMGTGDRGLYIIGGVLFLVGLALSRFMAQLNKKTKRLGE